MRVLLLGDVSPTSVTVPLFRDKRISELFSDVLAVFDENDFVFVNLECALTEHDKPIKKFGPALKAPKETAEVLKAIGVSCCGLSNNHIFDYGAKGANDTLKALNNVGIDTTGFGSNYEDSRRNYIVSQNGERICIIAVCEHEYSYALDNRMGSRPFDEYDTMEDIRNAKAEHDRVIVIYHGGKEFCRYPSPRLYKLCHAMAKNGADVILCQHSHCIGVYEKYNDCHILYGQGNFHFVKPHELEMWNNALAVTYDTLENEMDFIPIKTNGCGISLVHGEEKEILMAEFAQRSKTLQTGEWRRGWHDFCRENEDIYLKVITRACLGDSTERENARLSHYLDCEAHLDVLRELFPTYNITNEIEF